MHSQLRFLLLQIRNADDPIRAQEIRCFAEALQCEPKQIRVGDLLSSGTSQTDLDRCDVVLLGGSGHYSATGEGDWLDRALDMLRQLHTTAKPTFASCWGFQAMSRALGGKVVHDPAHAELGTIDLSLTDAGLEDPVFGPLGDQFQGQAGHEDCVTKLPACAIRLASSAPVPNQAFRIQGLPIYGTQFHPELRRADFLGRLRAYPEYVQRIAGVTLEQFAAGCHETPGTAALLRRFVRHVFAD